MRAGWLSSERVRLSVELLRDGINAPVVDALVTEVASNLFNPEQARFRRKAAGNGGPQFVIRAIGRERFPAQQRLETVASVSAICAFWVIPCTLAE